MKPLYICDLDGTLLTPEATLSAFTVQTINRLADAGMPITLATARSISSAAPIIAPLRLRVPAVMMNGVCITDTATKTHKFVAYLPDEVALQVVQAFLDCHRPPFLYTLEGTEFDVRYTHLCNEIDREFVAERQGRYRSFGPAAAYIPGGKCVQLNSLDTAETLDPVVRRLDKIEGIRYVYYHDTYHPGRMFLEVFSAAAGKWNGICRLAQMYGFDHITAFGDNGNDMEMLQKAHVGVAVGNALPRVKAVANRVIGPNTQDGVAKELLRIYNEE